VYIQAASIELDITSNIVRPMELWDSNGKDFVMTTAPLKNHKPMNLKCPGVAKM
jgi:hypothetical protein